MKINYTDADSRIHEMEVTDEVGNFYLASLEEEKFNDRRNTRRHTSLSTFEYEDARYFDSGIDICGQLVVSDAVAKALAPLSDRERYLLAKVCIEGWLYTELAAIEGRDESTIRKATDRAKKKFIKNYS